MSKTMVTEAQKRNVECPKCGAGKGKACKGSRQPSANSFGGGWGGAPDLDRAHAGRRARVVQAKVADDDGGMYANYLHTV